MTETATIGHNACPPVEAHALHIDELYAQAKDYLDGTEIATEEQAQDVHRFLTMFREAKTGADEQRKVEKAPHDAAAKAVQDAWLPIIGKCDTGATVCKRAETAWLLKVEAEQALAAEQARQVAEEARQAALKAEQAATASPDLAAAEKAHEAIKAANKLAAVATKAGKAKANVSGGGRAVGLRTSYAVTLTDPLAFGKWAWTARNAEYLTFLTELAECESRGGDKGLPGVKVETVRNAA